MKELVAFARSRVLTAFLCLASAAFASQYTAFSLRVAQQRIEKAGANWRQSEPEVLDLGGINKVEGFVYDTAAKDLILVGDHESDRAILTLDDLVVALRARFRYGEWPLVSIDPTPETKTTQMQHVRFEGGVENTAFGQAMYDADYRLKQMGMGLVEPGVVGLKTYWDRSVEEAQSGIGSGQKEVNSRFWFYPSNPHVVVRDGVCVVRGLKVGVFTEVLSAKIGGKAVEDVKAFKLENADAFASDVSQRFDDLCTVQPSYNRLRGLQELVAVSKALEELDEGPDLDWWLKAYPLVSAETPKETRVLTRKYDGAHGWLEVSGGVHLTALAMRLNAGDTKALREAVLAVRPTLENLSWQFVAAQWLIPLVSGQVGPEDITLLCQQSMFLEEQGRFPDALALYDRILETDSGNAVVWCGKSVTLIRLGRSDEALTCSNRALEIDPQAVEARNNKGIALAMLRRYDEAIKCYDEALEARPRYAAALSNKGNALADQGQYDEAVKCYDEALEVDPQYAEALSNKGNALADGAHYDEALEWYDRALEVNPGYANAWSNKGAALLRLGRCEEAIRCCDRALELDPRIASAWDGKCGALARLKRYDEALHCCDRSLEMDSLNAEAWYASGSVLLALGRPVDALQQLDRAIGIDPGLAHAHAARGLALLKLGKRDAALAEYGILLKLDASWAQELMRAIYE
ncbi:MAG: tetratricopeptide repeat protein [candidate division WOR-3 bacterium]|nr:tetratricopeptide repeat protein [candidate division WOR-3 bacterium]